MKHDFFLETTLTRAFNKASFYGFIAAAPLRHTFFYYKRFTVLFCASRWNGKVTTSSPLTL